VTGFLATGAEAQSAPGGLKRTIIKRLDGPMPGYETINVRVDLEAGAPIARHTHPGVESSYIVSGSTELTVEGEGTRIYNAGEGFEVPPGVPHGGKNGDKPTIIAATYVVEKGKPMASPA
jgi:quercetin dioxygenase-like cupin family protein